MKLVKYVLIAQTSKPCHILEGGIIIISKHIIGSLVSLNVKKIPVCEIRKVSVESEM